MKIAISFKVGITITLQMAGSIVTSLSVVLDNIGKFGVSRRERWWKLLSRYEGGSAFCLALFRNMYKMELVLSLIKPYTIVASTPSDRLFSVSSFILPFSQLGWPNSFWALFMYFRYWLIMVNAIKSCVQVVQVPQLV